MSRKESQTQQEKCEISNDWSEVYGVNTQSRWFEASWIESDSHQKYSRMCKLSRKVFTKVSGQIKTYRRFDMRKK